MRNRGTRQDVDRKAKVRAGKIMDRQCSALAGSDLDPGERARRVGKMASVHSKPCSCAMCGNARRKLGARTLQELRHDQGIKEE